MKFTLPDSPGGERWGLLIDTNDPDGDHQAKEYAIGAEYDVTPRSLRMFVLKHVAGVNGKPAA